jgi:hypothetical protein
VTSTSWRSVETIRPLTASTGHIAGLLHSGLGGQFSWNWTCSCWGEGHPEAHQGEARQQAQEHVDYPDGLPSALTRVVNAIRFRVKAWQEKRTSNDTSAV